MAARNGMGTALFLLPAFYILHSYNQLTGFIELQQVFRAVLLCYIPLLIFYFGMIRFGVSKYKTTLILFSVTVFVLFFGAIQKALYHLPFLSFLKSFLVFTLLSLAILIFIINKILKSKNNFKISTPAAIIVIALFILEIGVYYANSRLVQRTKNLIYPNKPLSERYTPSNKPDSSKPDIYFLVFDAYTNNATLKTVWNFDNSNLTNWLEGNGFHVGSNTHSNYNFTAFSVSSTFNMNFITPEKGDDAGKARNVLQANRSLSDNEVFSILKKEDYKIRFLAPFSNSIENNGLLGFFDYLSDGQITGQTFPGCLHKSSLLKTIRNQFRAKVDEEEYYAPFKNKLNDIRLTVEMIKKTADSISDRKPQFVYGHIMIPHEPPLFNDKGKFITPEEFPVTTPYNSYVNQIKFANTIIEELVGFIRTHNKPNTVVIIEGDHGFGFYSRDSIPVFAFKNLNAIYYPDRDYERLYDTLSPINHFRILFDKYFGQQFPLLKDSSTIVRE